MITAANTGNVRLTPAFGWTDPMNAKSSIAASAASIEHSMNAANLYFMIGSRARSAAAALPPIALRRNPNSDRLRMNPMTIATPVIHRACIGMLNGSAWLDSAKNHAIWSGGTTLPGGGYEGFSVAVLDTSSVVPNTS